MPKDAVVIVLLSLTMAISAGAEAAAWANDDQADEGILEVIAV